MYLGRVEYTEAHSNKMNAFRTVEMVISYNEFTTLFFFIELKKHLIILDMKLYRDRVITTNI